MMTEEKQGVFIPSGWYVGTREACKMIGMTSSHLRYRCREGSIRSIEISPRSCIISVEEVNRVINEDDGPEYFNKRGRPRGS